MSQLPWKQMVSQNKSYYSSYYILWKCFDKTSKPWSCTRALFGNLKLKTVNKSARYSPLQWDYLILVQICVVQYGSNWPHATCSYWMFDIWVVLTEMCSAENTIFQKINIKKDQNIRFYMTHILKWYYFGYIELKHVIKINITCFCLLFMWLLENLKLLVACIVFLLDRTDLYYHIQSTFLVIQYLAFCSSWTFWSSYGSIHIHLYCFKNVILWLIKYLLTAYHVSDSIVGIGDTVVNKMN